MNNTIETCTKTKSAETSAEWNARQLPHLARKDKEFYDELDILLGIALDDADEIHPAPIAETVPAESSSAVDPVEVAHVEVKDKYADGYEFPVEALEEDWTDLKAMTVAELAEALSDLSYATKGKELVPYGEIRLKACAISVELNRRGKLAPRFRKLRRPPMKVETSDDLALSRDRQFIDLHWLRCIGWNRKIHGENFRFDDALSVKTFNAEKVEMFAAVPVSAEEKASWLALPPYISFQLAAVQTKAIRERFRVASVGDVVSGKIRQVGRMQVTQLLEISVAHLPQHQVQIPRWATIWMCAKLVGSNPEVLRQFHALAEGLEKPLDGRDISRRLASVKKRLGEGAPDKLVA